jgi:hypothetical protein
MKMTLSTISRSEKADDRARIEARMASRRHCKQTGDDDRHQQRAISAAR